MYVLAAQEPFAHFNAIERHLRQATKLAKTGPASRHDRNRELREGTGWDGRIRTYGTLYQKQLPYHLATSHQCCAIYAGGALRSRGFFVKMFVILLVPPDAANHLLLSLCVQPLQFALALHLSWPEHP